MPTTAPRITVRQRGQNFGPYTTEQTNTLLVAGRVHPDDLAWLEGTPEWTRLAALPGIVAVPPTPPKHAAREVDPDASDYKILPAFLLALFVGVFGVHRFYVGKVSSAIVMLLLTLSLIGAMITVVWATVDWILIVTGNFRDEDDRLLTQWA